MSATANAEAGSGKSEVQDGGPAFPYECFSEEDDQVRQFRGMSLRDYFAGQALTLLDLPRVDDSKWTGIKARCTREYSALTAALAYDIADAMLRERIADAKQEEKA